MKLTVLIGTEFQNSNLVLQMAQELNLVERREDYVNIYTETYRMQVKEARHFGTLH